MYKTNLLYVSYISISLKLVTSVCRDIRTDQPADILSNLVDVKGFSSYSLLHVINRFYLAGMANLLLGINISSLNS